MESMRRVARCRDGEEIRIDGLFDHAGAGDGVGHDDVFDLGDVFGWRGGELFVGAIVGDEGGDGKGGAFEGADSGYESRAWSISCSRVGRCDTGLPGTVAPRMLPLYPPIYPFTLYVNPVLPSSRRSTYGTVIEALSNCVGICSAVMRMSFWNEIVTRTGCFPAGNPFGKRVLSDVGSGTRVYGFVAFSTVAVSTGTIKYAVEGHQYVPRTVMWEKKLSGQHTCVHTLGAQIGIVNGEVIRACRRLRGGNSDH